MSTLDSIIRQVVNGACDQLLRDAWREELMNVIAQYAVSNIDPQQLSLLSGWDSLDNPQARQAHLQPKISAVSSLCATKFAKEQRTHFESAIDAAFLIRPSAGTLEKSIATTVQYFIENVDRYKRIVSRNPFPACWPKIANELARLAVSSLPEWKLMNVLLLSGFFQSCILPSAKLVSAALQGLSNTGLKLRGSLVRIPDKIKDGAIVDISPPIAQNDWLAGSISLDQKHWSELQGYLNYEALQVSQSHGIIHNMLNIDRPVPSYAGGSISDVQMRLLRDVGFKEYEYTVISFMALSAIEQALRSWASHNNVSHIKNGEPQSWSEWSGLLGCSPALYASLQMLYSPDGPNLRNRIMHGGLIESEGKRMETTSDSIIDPRYAHLFSSLNKQQDPFSTRNIANLCLGVLIDINKELVSGNISFTLHDRQWETVLALTDDEIDFGIDTYCDFIHSQEVAEGLRRRFFGYLQAVMPVFSTYAKVGFHGFIKHSWDSASYIQHMYLGLTFEGIFRLTIHLLNFSILQSSAKNGLHRNRFRMLTAQTGGLLSNASLSRLMQDLAPEERPTAEKILNLAIKARNALAHGAILPQTERRWKGEGHIIIKAIQLLEHVGLKHLAREAAYFRFLKRPQSSSDDHSAQAVSDWVGAEADIANMLNSILNS
jgi:hypothetical protein